MKTYTFAEKNATTAAHMQGLVKALTVWAEDATKAERSALRQKGKNYQRGRSDAFREIIAVIEDSNSI